MKKSTLLTIAAIAVAAVIIFVLYQVLREIPFMAPAKEAVPSGHKTIGVVYPQQLKEAVTGLEQGLADIGYADIGYEYVETQSGPTLAADITKATKVFAEKNVDLIFAAGDSHSKAAVLATKEIGSTIPIVFLTHFRDPIKHGVVQSFKSSGNNATGVASDIVEVVQKQLEFLKRINSDGKKIGVFTDGFAVSAVGEAVLAEFRVQAPRFGYTVVEYKTSVPPPQAEKAWYEIAGNIKPGDIDALFHVAGHYFQLQETAEGELANRLKIPLVGPLEDLPNGGHFGYSNNFITSGKQAARLVDKIFRGEKPTNIPVEFTENTLAVYVDRARESGFTFPESMLSFAEIRTGDARPWERILGR